MPLPPPPCECSPCAEPDPDSLPPPEVEERALDLADSLTPNDFPTLLRWAVNNAETAATYVELVWGHGLADAVYCAEGHMIPGSLSHKILRQACLHAIADSILSLHAERI